MSKGMIVVVMPEKCKNCIHHKIVQEKVDICDYTERYDSHGCPVPYPYFFGEDCPCRGYQERSDGE